MPMTTTITSLPSIAILIDCWKSSIPDRNLENCFKRITEVLDSTDNIKTVVLASYNCRNEQIKNEQIWYQNNLALFKESTKRKIPHLKQAHDFLNMHDTKYPEETTDPIILNYKNPTKYQISMRWWWELEYYLSLHPEIKNIYMFGQAWEICVRDRPLGYMSILEEKSDLNILTDTKCFLYEAHSKPINLNNDPEWVCVEGSTYLYQSTNRL